MTYTQEKVSPLRARMIEDMRIKGLGESAQKAHIRAVRYLAEFLGRSPDTATEEDLRAYQLHMVDTNVTPSTYNARLVGLRFFFETTCKRPEMKGCMHFRTEPRKLPVVFSAEEVLEILRVAPGPGLKYRAALSISYGTGLRASEVCNLIRPTARELRWFAHIDRHGPQSSEFLYECTLDTHSCRDSALRRLQALREAGYLRLPPQQRQIAKADFNPYVYDLTPLGWNVLSHDKDLERHCRPTGHWWHSYWVSAVTSAIEIEASRARLTYIPVARILAINNAQMAIPLGRQKLSPDQIFAIKYPEGYRAFALEVDRGTEPVRSAAARKSLKRSIEQYQTVLKQHLHQRHYGLKSNLAVFWVFTSATRQAQFLKLLDHSDRQFLSQSVSTSVPRYPELAQSMSSVVSIQRT